MIQSASDVQKPSAHDLTHRRDIITWPHTSVTPSEETFLLKDRRDGLTWGRPATRTETFRVPQTDRLFGEVTWPPHQDHSCMSGTSWLQGLVCVTIYIQLRMLGHNWEESCDPQHQPEKICFSSSFYSRVQNSYISNMWLMQNSLVLSDKTPHRKKEELVNNKISDNERRRRKEEDREEPIQLKTKSLEVKTVIWSTNSAWSFTMRILKWKCRIQGPANPNTPV